MAGFLLGLDTQPMEAKVVDTLPVGAEWQFEPKWDGFRCLAFKAGAEIELRAKSGKPLGRYFPEMVESLARAQPDDFVLDGELMVPRGDTLSFGALQDRVHPAASRIRKLAADTPALLVVFDCLATAPSGPLLHATLPERRAALERLMPGFARADRVRLSPFTADRAEAARWLAGAHGALDGVVAKRLDTPYAAGKREMLKVKTHRSADCIVGGFRYGKQTRLVASLLLGLYNADGKLDHVGFTSAISQCRARGADETAGGAGRAAPGFTGDAPGAPSRWSQRPLRRRGTRSRPELVVEVSLRSGYRRQASVTARCCCRWRPDKAPAQCTRDQIAQDPQQGPQQDPQPGALVEAIR